MRPDLNRALLAAIDGGPDYLRHGLLCGEQDRVMLGLRAHAGTIAHARHIPLEESYPRTREMIGAEAFHALADRFLATSAVRSRTISGIGSGFAEWTEGAARSLALIEWAWLEAHGAGDDEPLDLAAIAGMSPELLAGLTVKPHTAARLAGGRFEGLFFDDCRLLGEHVLVTRPREAVIVTSVRPAVAAAFDLLQPPLPFAVLLDADPAAATTLVEIGALTFRPETE